MNATTTNGTANGKSKSLTVLNRELKAAKVELELRQTKRAVKLMEEYAWGEVIDPADRWRDADGQVWLPIGANRDDRKQGQNAPFITSETQLSEMRTIARVLAETNPTAIGIFTVLEAFIIGEGYTYRVTSKDKAQQDLVSQAQNVIDEFLDVNEWNEMEQELFRRSRRDGEYFLRYHVDDGVTHVRVIEPEYVTGEGVDYKEKPEWAFGIHTEKDDVVKVLGYRVAYSNTEDGEEIEPDELDHIKVNVDRNIKRGMSDFYATQEMLDGIRKLLRNLREGAAIQAAIAGIREHKAATRSGVEGLQSEVQAYTRKSPVTGKTISYQKIEPGTVIDVPETLKWLSAPIFSANAGGHIEILKAVFRGVAQRWGLPEYMVSSDASNANYASTLIAGSPFVRIAKKWQRFYKTRFLRTIWRAIENAIDASKLDKAALDLLDVQCEAPQVEIENRLEEAQIKDVEHRNSIVSKQTWRQKAGYDDEQEKVNLQQEPAPQPQPATNLMAFGEDREDSLSFPFRLLDGIGS